jgi:hypothetical protein
MWFKLFGSFLGPALRALGSWCDLKKAKLVAANTEKVVQAHEAKNIEVDRGEIRELIHTAHFDPDPKKRQAAFEEIQKREAIT